MYTILKCGLSTTKGGSGNIGEALIDETCKQFISDITGDNDFLEITYCNLAESDIDNINKTKAVLMPAFTFWNGLKSENTIFQHYNNIKVPIIPLACNTIFFPATIKTIKQFKLDEETINCLKLIFKDVKIISCRDKYVEKILNRHGFKNTVMCGDFGWYNPINIEKQMKKPKALNKIIFTIGHYRGYYKNQILDVMKYIRNKFPDSEITYSLHTSLDKIEPIFIEQAKKLHFSIIETKNDASVLSIYDNFDFHIGYRVHGYVYFLRQRIPGILIAEDNRGIGFGKSLGNIGVFPGSIEKCNIINILFNKKCKIKPDSKIINKIDKFINRQIKNKFSDYDIIPNIIDSTYNNIMIPHLKNIFSEIEDKEL